MLPIILAIAGGYLIADSIKKNDTEDLKKLNFEDGGEMMAKGGMSYGNRRVKYKGFEIIQHDGHCEIKGYSSMSGTFFQSGDIETIEQGKEVIDLALNEKNIPNIKDIHKRIVHYSDNRYNKNLPQYADGGKMADGGEVDETRIGKNVFKGNTFKTEEEAKIFIKAGKPFLRKQLKEGNWVLVYNGEEYYIAEKKMAEGGVMAKGGGMKDRSEKDSIKLSKEYQKVLDSNFDDKVYEKYEKIVKETQIPKEELQKIEHYVSTTPKGKRRDIDIYRYW
jgi:hypothetical protein